MSIGDDSGVSNVISEAMAKAYREGFIDGLKAYTWWKDGVEYVGGGYTTLKRAIEIAKEELA